MSEVRLYMDEDAGENAVVQGLRARGFDVLITIEAKHGGIHHQGQLRRNDESHGVLIAFCVAELCAAAGTSCDRQQRGKKKGGPPLSATEQTPVGYSPVFRSTNQSPRVGHLDHKGKYCDFVHGIVDYSVVV